MRSAARYTFLVMALAACAEQHPKESPASAARRDSLHRVDAARRDSVQAVRRDSVQAARLPRIRPLEIRAPTLVLFYPVPDWPDDPNCQWSFDIPRS